MKKIISICLLVVLVGTNFSFATGIGTVPSGNFCTATKDCKSGLICLGNKCITDANAGKSTIGTIKSGQFCTAPADCVFGLTCLSNKCTTDVSIATADCSKCTKLSLAKTAKGCNSTKETQRSCSDGIYCCPNSAAADPTDSTSVMGIDCDQNQLVNGQCKLNIYDTLGIRKSVGGNTSVGLFVQDVVLSATFFIGTLITVALIVSGIMFIFAASSGKDPANAKKGMIGSLVGLLIVVSSYVIIRLVQYIAKGF